MLRPILRFSPLCDGSDIERAMLGHIEVGRTCSRDKRAGRASWYSILPNQHGIAHIDWHPAKHIAHARAALQAHVEDWLGSAGLQIATPNEDTRRGQVDLRQPLPAPPDFPDATGQQEG